MALTEIKFNLRFFTTGGQCFILERVKGSEVAKYKKRRPWKRVVVLTSPDGATVVRKKYLTGVVIERA